ncbi:FAD-dependent thymidylate synthase [Candidatus Uhrbacteria bacterium]|nr:FAD-dependent thymidylate synthase [Candidatus Uhrbacteria bacterium]
MKIFQFWPLRKLKTGASAAPRYVFYDQKEVDGSYRYYREPGIMASPYAHDYVSAMDFIFQTYCDLVEPMQEYYRGLKPMEEAEYDINGDGAKEKLKDLTAEADVKAFQRTYKSDLRTKACDTLRYLLPIATKTNVGMFGNGRFFQYLLSHLYTSPFEECQDIARSAHQQLNQTMPQYVRRAKASEYRAATEKNMASLARELLAGTTPRAEEAVVLLDGGEDRMAKRILELGESSAEVLKSLKRDEADYFMISAMLYPYLAHPFRQIREVVRSFSDDVRRKIITTYYGDRKTRRDRPYRALESGYTYTLDLVTDFGTYKDLMRHRMNTQLRQKFSPKLGFDMPEDLVTAGFRDRALACNARAEELHDKLVSQFPLEASYTTLHGSKVRWLLGMNDREAMHLLELRTTPQGHPSYRRCSQMIHNAIKAAHPWRGEMMKFVDHNDYFWSRGDAEARQRVKEKELDVKYGAPSGGAGGPGGGL